MAAIWGEESGEGEVRWIPRGMRESGKQAQISTGWPA